MFVVCNGAYKSGSSWLFHIVQEFTEFRFPIVPTKIRNGARSLQ
jgi:hypothetical protein